METSATLVATATVTDIPAVELFAGDIILMPAQEGMQVLSLRVTDCSFVEGSGMKLVYVGLESPGEGITAPRDMNVTVLRLR